MKKRLLIFLLGIVLSVGLVKHLDSLTVLWTETFDGPTNNYDVFLDVAVDSDDNVYVVGVSSNGANDMDAILRKYNTSGLLQWTTTYNSPASNHDRFDAVAVDTQNFIYAVGSEFRSDVTQYMNILIHKYDSSGLLAWTTTYDSTGIGNDSAFGVAIDTNTNDVWITGISDDTDLILRKYDSNGNLLLSVLYSSANMINRGNSLVVDSTGNVYVTGVEIVYQNNQSGDLLLMKYSSTGTMIWHSTYTSIAGSWETGIDLTIDESTGIYVVGYEDRKDLFQSDNFLVTKFNLNDGLLQWVTTYNNISNYPDAANGVALSSTTDIYAIGTEFVLPTTGQALNGLIRTYTSNGLLTDTSSFHSASNRYESCHKIAIDSFNNLILVGYEIIDGQLTNGWVKKLSP